MIIGKFVIVAIVAYLLGAIPFALMISKKLAGVDISKFGSGNIGGTNVYRVLGRKAGAIAVILDLAKAFTAVIIRARIIRIVPVRLETGCDCEYHCKNGQAYCNFSDFHGILHY